VASFPTKQEANTNKGYFVLALGHRNVQLYEGDRDTIRPVNLKNFPNDMVNSLRVDEYPQSRQTHTIASASHGKGSEGFHEQYDIRSIDKKMLKEFFRRVDKQIHSYLYKHQHPLILAGVGYELAIYRTVNTYPHLLADMIAGSTEDINLQDIRKKAWAIVGGGSKR